MSFLHLRPASTTLFERLHRTIVVLTGVFLPVAQRARRTLRDRIAAVYRRLTRSRRTCAPVSSAVAPRAPFRDDGMPSFVPYAGRGSMKR